MSNVIPILSSSPPPIDDHPSCDESWESNNFSGFKDSGHVHVKGSLPLSQTTTPAKNEHCNFPKGNVTNNEVLHDGIDDDWADFSGPLAPPPVVDGEFVTGFAIDDSKTGSSASVNAKDVALDGSMSSNLPSQMGLQLRNTIDRTVAHGDGRKSPRSSSSSTGSQEDRHNSCGEDFYHTRTHEQKFLKGDTQDNTSQDSVTDSGLCSDISPVPKLEEYPDFGDTKSYEVEFSDECQNKVGTILEHDEGFANFGTRDSCGTGSDNQSPDRDSIDHTQAFSVDKQNYPDPLNFRPGTTFSDDADPIMGRFSCSSGEGASPDLDPDAVTPTQAQYDAENLDSLNSSSSLDPKISPQNDEVLSSDSMSRGQLNGTSIDEKCETLECTQAESADLPLDSMGTFADFQSTGTITNFTPCQEKSVDVDTMTTSCASSGSQPVEIDRKSGPETGQQSSMNTASTIENVEESDDEWDFKDAVGAETTVEPVDMQRRLLPTPAAQQSSNGFDDFTNSTDMLTGNNGIQDDEDDAWAFQSPVHTAEVNDDDDNDDDFGDFGDFSSTNVQSGFADFGGNKQTECDGDTNWASFASPALTLPDEGTAEEDNEEFANFADAGIAESLDLAQPFASGQHLPVAQILTNEQVDLVVSRSFAQDDEPEDLAAVDMLYVHMTHQTLRQQTVPAKQPGRHANVKSITTDMSVWNNLRDLEKTAALRYVWDKSTTNNCLLHALSIDTRNILIGHKKPSVPIFAANLGSGVLEPSRGLPEVGREGRVSDVVNITHVPINTKLTAGTPQDIPPAEFDWSSAGLTNPLDSLENELLKSIEPLESKQPKTLEPLENYLANLKVAPTALPNMTGENDADHLTEAAYDIVTRFPPIKFMHANMLMFPVKGTTTD